MKIVLADDEQMIRLGLINMLEEIGFSTGSIYQAKNGQELLSISKEKQPDLAFIDIKMPVMDGLEALQKMHFESPNTQCIMLTGYAEFEYAQSALSYNAVDYLLKPVSLTTLKKSIDRINQILIKNWKQANAEFAMALFEHFSTYSEGFSETVDTSLNGPFSLSLIYSNRHSNNSEFDTILNQYRDSLRDSLAGHYSICHPFIEADVCVVTELIDEGNKQSISDLEESFKAAGYCVFSDILPTIEKLIETAYIINKNAILRFATKKTVSSLKELPFNEDLRLFCKSIYEAVEALNENNRFLFDGWISRLVNIKTADFEQDIVLSALKYHFPILYSIDELSDIAPYLNKAGEIQFSATNSKKGTLAESVKSYIDSNYHLDIGTAVIAETFNITPNYLSSIFKKSFDVGLLTYLTRVRMYKAKQILLNNPSVSIHALASSVGYSNSNYFSKVFQKTFGVLPSEFH